jgi:hypothetical protein|nr:MAG TPA: hypothetical protein [Caudoviricetes sp.]
MRYTELKEIIKNWDKEQTRATHTLLEQGEALEDIINLIDNQEFMFYPNLEEYIMQALENVSYIPDWVCIDVVRTYKTALRYEDNIIFVDSLPKWAEGGAEYGTEEEKQKYKEGIKYLCEYSEVLEVYR